VSGYSDDPLHILEWTEGPADGQQARFTVAGGGFSIERLFLTLTRLPHVTWARIPPRGSDGAPEQALYQDGRMVKFREQDVPGSGEVLKYRES